jgi:ketosteroid isomerase-like protein
MTPVESDEIIRAVKEAYSIISSYSQTAQVDSFLSYYANTPGFVMIGSDGVMRNYEEFKKICTEYYKALQVQQVRTTKENFQVIDSNLVLLAWTGDIMATMKNGDVMKMPNYSITSVFRKIDGKWKVIHDHESSIPPEIIKKR